MATIKSIAEKLNLSSATVSRALRNDPGLSIPPETRVKIQQAAEEMGYTAKKRKKSNSQKELAYNILIIHKQQTFRNQIDSSYYFSVRSGLEEYASKNACTCRFLSMEDLENAQENVDGIIIIGNYAKEFFKKIIDMYQNKPIVSIGIIAYYPEIIDHITHSNYISVTMALSYLTQKGHRKIGYLGIKEAAGTEDFGSRKQTFISYMEKLGEYNPLWVYECDHGHDRVEQGYLTMMAWLSKQEPLPTAIFCANDPVALGALMALHENSIKIPVEISVIAHDGSFHGQYSIPPLTTIDVNPYNLGIEGIKNLLDRIKGERSIPQSVMLYPHLLERSSVGPPRTTDINQV